VRRRRATGVAASGFLPRDHWSAVRRGRASSSVSRTAAVLAAEAGHGGSAGNRQLGPRKLGGAAERAARLKGFLEQIEDVFLSLAG
jgi:hypothetical protein